MKGRYLITTDAWFYAPDGKLYKAAWGNVEMLEDDVLGVKTNRNSSNWYAKIGNKDNHVIVAGCNIHYAVKCNEEPNTNSVEEQLTSGDSVVTYDRINAIYIAE